VICDTPPTSESETRTSETPTSESETPTSESEKPVTIITTESSSPASPANNQTSKTPELRSPEVEATRLTQPAVLPKTGPDLPIGAALAVSLLFIGLGILLLLGSGRLAPERYFRKH
jgi:hypothetical protein